MTTFATAPPGAQIRRLTRRLLADGETAIGLYRKLAGDRPGTFLLESAENGRAWSRYSFIGVRASAVLTEEGGRARWIGTPPPGVPVQGDPLDVLRGTIDALRVPRDPGLPPLTGGLVGFIGYDMVRRLEKLPDATVDDLHLPELVMLLVTDLAVLDHHDGSVLLIANVLPGDSPDAARARLEEMTDALRRPAPSTVTMVEQVPARPPLRRTSSEEYRRWVERAREYIRAGDIYQVVASQRFEMQTTASALDIYRVLRTRNPSPYLYLLRFDGFDVVGSSPEAHVTVKDGRATMHPIAGSSPRGATPEEDAALAAAMLADPKERAEHVMLVDLARNDLGRVCVPGTVEVVDFMAVERYSHIMHLVSTVVGHVAPDRSALDVLTATFPAGTLTGAPKVRAMEIIEELEPTRRGLYGGVVGYVDFAGDLDTAIAIRTALLRDHTVYVQAGAGLVADSDPVKEDLECRNKANTVLSAVTIAETLQPAE
ncbi:MAG: anthranilate synthase component I [Acidothermus sp.]|nr:anthranilate synthase component I [Acidothermus sp.]